MQKTITVQVGNTDNKLTQQEWAMYCSSIHRCLNDYGEIHFSAPSVGWADWQNACWVIILYDDLQLVEIEYLLAAIRKKFNQESLAITVGTTIFL